MKCVKCGENNKDGASFCSKCGSKLEAKKEDKKEKVEVEEKNDDVVTVSIDTKEAKNFFAYLKDVFVSPAKTTKKALKKVKTTQDAFMLSLFVTLTALVINLVVNMVSCIFVKQYSFLEGTKLVVDFAQIGKLDYISLIFKAFAFIAVIILGIASVYYIATLVLKKEVPYRKFLIVSTNAFIPMAFVPLLICPIVSIISVPVSSCLALLAMLYMGFILVSGMNSLVEIEDTDRKMYFHLVCLGILMIAFYFITTEILVDAAVGALGSLS